MSSPPPSSQSPRDDWGWDWSPPDYTEPILAARVWQVAPRTQSERTAKNLRLASLTIPFIWPIDIALVGVCEPWGQLARAYLGRDVTEGTHPVPTQECGCGIWGMSDPYSLQRQAGSLIHLCVWGTVELWGKVVIGTKGYRAQKARAVALMSTPPPSMVIRPMAGEPVTPLEIQVLADRYGLDLIDQWPSLTNPSSL